MADPIARSAAAGFDIVEADGARILRPSGSWTIDALGAVEKALSKVQPGGDWRLDVAALERVDTAGAWLIDRTLNAGRAEPADWSGAGHDGLDRLLAAIAEARPPAEPPPKPPNPIAEGLERIGRSVVKETKEFLNLLGFIGRLTATVGRLMLTPHRIRWTSVFRVAEDAGLDALPIIAILSFFIGLVLAFLSARMLSQFGASIFTVELVAIAMLREFGVVLTAILLAGRTDSAFTAQIGAMRMRQEVDAMTTLGLDTMEVLVAPRFLAMLIMTPILAFFATVSGMIGGLLVCWSAFDIPPILFLTRVQDLVPIQHFWVGLVKAPFFALIVAVVGCRQGLLVGGDVQSLGERTTTSVVQAIFLVILLDAIFAIIFLEMDV